jgi:hypothetical protein
MVCSQGGAGESLDFASNYKKLHKKEEALIKDFSLQIIGTLIFRKCLSARCYAVPATPGAFAGPRSTPAGVATCTGRSPPYRPV